MVKLVVPILCVFALLVGQHEAFSFHQVRSWKQQQQQHATLRRIILRVSQFDSSSLSLQEEEDSDSATDISRTSSNAIVGKRLRLVVFPKNTSGDRTEEKPKIPCVPSLDVDGLLPPGAYRRLGDERFEPKPTCLVSTALRVHPDSLGEHDSIASAMHRFLDAGLTTFQLDHLESSALPSSWGLENVYGTMYANTPKSILDTCHFVVPMKIPMATEKAITSSFSTNVMGVDRTSVRKMVTDILDQMGNDVVDTLQLTYNNGSPYHIDVLDYLKDLQRDGLIRSVSGRNWPSSLMGEATSMGFSLDSHQLDTNLLYLHPYKTSCHGNNADPKNRPPLLLSRPLAGGLLTSQHLAKLENPPWWKLQPPERQQLELLLQEKMVLSKQKSRLKHEHQLWNVYQDVLQDLDYIALKHRTTIGAVAIRWALQLNMDVSSAVVGCDISRGDFETTLLDDRIRRMRDVFRFELDEEDMEALQKISGKTQNEPVLDFDRYKLENHMTDPDMDGKLLF